MSKKKKPISTASNTSYRIPQNQNTGLYDTSYVLADIFKTFILTMLIIGIEVALFYFLKNKLIVIPFISY